MSEIVGGAERQVVRLGQVMTESTIILPLLVA